MKRMTVMLAGLALLLSLGAVQALAEDYDQESVATLANDAGLSLEGLSRDQVLFYDVPRVSAEGPPEEDDADRGILTCHFTDGCGYAVNPQVMVDLQYRIATVDSSERTVASNGIGDRLAPNLMLGVHFNF